MGHPIPFVLFFLCSVRSGIYFLRGRGGRGGGVFFWGARGDFIDGGRIQTAEGRSNRRLCSQNNACRCSLHNDVIQGNTNAEALALKNMGHLGLDIDTLPRPNKDVIPGVTPARFRISTSSKVVNI